MNYVIIVRLRYLEKCKRDHNLETKKGRTTNLVRETSS